MLSHLTGFAHFGFESGLSSKSGLLLFKQVQGNSGIKEEQQRLIVNYERVTDWPWVGKKFLIMHEQEPVELAEPPNITVAVPLHSSQVQFLENVCVEY